MLKKEQDKSKSTKVHNSLSLIEIRKNKVFPFVLQFCDYLSDFSRFLGGILAQCVLS